MEVEIYEGDDLVTLQVKGEIEVYSLPEFSKIAEAQLGIAKRVTLDLEKLDYIDSSGLGYIVTLHERLQKNDQELVLINLQSHVNRVFKITRLDQILCIASQEPVG
ncbi:MAG: STAS domain-containing protein [bacterium]|nr:STAS domain-containing protein [bacterium]